MRRNAPSRTAASREDSTGESPSPQVPCPCRFRRQSKPSRASARPAGRFQKFPSSPAIRRQCFLGQIWNRAAAAGKHFPFPGSDAAMRVRSAFPARQFAAFLLRCNRPRRASLRPLQVPPIRKPSSKCRLAASLKISRAQSISSRPHVADENP